MLQRAASNAYSWWWASHIRTKQSKWLDNNLQDMEESVTSMLKLIEEDADSFAKKAEMYFLKRPELIKLVEESYRSYRALADRYDHISGALHKANNTIATVFPDQVQFAMEDEEDDSSPKVASIDPSMLNKVLPKNPEISLTAKDLKSSLALTKSKPKSVSSPMSKDKSQEEIDKLQKGILVLQTEKEFVKSSYESGLAKYWDIEKKITEMQEEVCCLQDEFSGSVVIEDDEARALMAATALKSCEDTLVYLQEKQKISAEEARVESERIKDAKEKFKALKGDCVDFQESQEFTDEATEPDSDVKQLGEVCILKQEGLELQSVCKKVKEHFGENSGMSVLDAAEKIDELVNKVISLEMSVSSQAAQIKRLRLETDELQKHLHCLEEDKMTLVDDTKNPSGKLKQVEEELHRVQDLETCVLDENNKFQTHFTEACHSFNDLSEKLQSPKKQDEVDFASLTQEREIVLDTESGRECEEQEDMKDPRECKMQEDMKAPTDESVIPSNNLIEEVTQGMQELDHCDKVQENVGLSEDGHILDTVSEKLQSPKQQDEVDFSSLTQEGEIVLHTESDREQKEQEDMKNPRECKMQEDMKDPTDESVIPSNNLIEEATQGMQELEHCDKDQENDAHSEDVHILDTVAEKLEEPKQEADLKKTDSLQAANSCHLHGECQTQNAEEEDLPNWQQLFVEGLEDREKILLSEYTSILRNYKETKRRLLEAEKKNQDYLFETISQIRDLKNTNAMKDEEIRSLRQILNFLQTNCSENLNTHLVELEGSQHQKLEGRVNEETSWFSASMTESSDLTNSGMLKDQNVESAAAIDRPQEEGAMENNIAEDFNEPHAASAIEEKFRRDIDELLEENLEFWLRFSSSFHQIQKFQITTQDLQAEISKLKDSKKQEGSTSAAGEQAAKQEATPIYKQLRELQTELNVWLEQNVLLKEELQCRFSSLCDIKEEISRISKEGLENEDVHFTAYQAAKFQGEVLNMQQENNKVADELQAGLDHVRSLQIEVEKTLSKLHENFKVSGSKSNHHYHFRHFSSRTRIPLRSFLFGVKPKPKKPSIFSCMNPALQKQYSDLTGGLPT